jgi:hypothetical protein
MPTICPFELVMIIEQGRVTMNCLLSLTLIYLDFPGHIVIDICHWRRACNLLGRLTFAVSDKNYFSASGTSSEVLTPRSALLML